MSIPRGLNAFPLTPFARDGSHDAVDDPAFVRTIERLRDTRVDAITALGSTGSYAYLDLDERNRVTELAVEHAGETPVCIGVGALRTSHVLANVASAERAGAAGVLLAPVSYQRLRNAEVFDLFRTVSNSTDLPIIVYDNPGTTHFEFSLEMYARICELPGVTSLKIPPVSRNSTLARERISAIRAVLPAHVGLGISGITAPLPRCSPAATPGIQ